MEKINILITDDHALVRDGWRFILNIEPRFDVVAEAGNGEEAIELVSQLRPDIVLLDINLPGINGIDVIRLIEKISPGTKALGLSMHTQPALVKKMLQHGAKGYVTKSSSGEELRKAIIEIYNNRSYVCDEIKMDLAERLLLSGEQYSGIDSLSKREIEIIEFIRKGFSARETGQLLNIGTKTVEAHRYNILKKLGLKNAPALVNYVNSIGLSLNN